MEYATCTTNDGCKLAFQTSQPLTSAASGSKPCIVLLHIFAGSSEHFTRNFDSLAQDHWVVAPDMRGHGRSDHTRGGYHVARLAADLKDLILYLRESAPETKIVAVGCSIGAAILWTYSELFGCDDFAGFVFVDQAPLQDRSIFDDWNETKSSKGLYNEATMLATQHLWIGDPQTAHKLLAESCLGYRVAPLENDHITAEQQAKDEAFFMAINATCDSTWLMRLLTDHTRYDHREAIEDIKVPTLVIAGRRSGIFPIEGVLETVRRMETRTERLVKSLVFDSGHLLFYEEPDKFNKSIITFAQECTSY